MAFINGNDVLLHAHIEDDETVQTCTLGITSANGNTIICVEATVFENEMCKRYAYRVDGGAPADALTIENVVCGSLLYIYDSVGQTFSVSNGATVIGKKNSDGYFLTAPTQKGTARIIIDV